MPVSMAKQVARSLLAINAVRFSPDKPFTYTSGMKSPIYCDIRLLMSFPEERSKVISSMIAAVGELLDWHDIDVISGTATAGIPLASWIADRMHLPMIYVRSSKKKHGLGNQIEGSFDEGAKALIVEDIISSGKSSMENIQAIRDNNAVVAGCISVACYEMPMAIDQYKQENVPLRYLTPMKDVIAEAVEQNILSQDERQVVLDWLKDPKGWAERQGIE